MARTKNNQKKLFDDHLDNSTAAAADRYLKLIGKQKKDKELIDVAGRNLIGLMKKINKTQVRHHNVTIKIKTTESKEKLQLKDLDKRIAETK